MLVGLGTLESVPCINGFKEKENKADEGQTSGGSGCVTKAIDSRSPSTTA